MTSDPRLLSTALDALREDAIVCDAAGVVVSLGAKAARMLGLDAQAHLPEPLAAAVRRALTGEMGTTLLRSPGDRMVRCAVSPLVREGAPIGVLIDARDATTEADTAAELRRSAVFLDSVVENIPDMIFVKDARDLRFERFNRAGEELLGLTRAELLGRNDYDFFPEEQAAFFQARDRETLAFGTVVDIPEEPIDTPRGQRWLHTKKIPILDEQGRPLYLLGISADITARKHAEEALRRANEELERRVTDAVEALERTERQLLQAQKMEAIGRLAGGVAHDFNNMLTVIRTYGELVATGRGDARAHATQIVRAADRAAGLTQQLLAFSRQQVLEPDLVDLDAIVRDLRPMLQRLVGEDVRLDTRLGDPIGAVYADRGQLEQVIVNLVVNARDAMPDGGRLTLVTRELDAGPEAPSLVPGRYVALDAIDTGVGMAPEVQTRIFEPFFTTKERGKGTGLGLSTVHGIIRQSGGDVLVDSTPGQGTTFTVLLPKAEGVAQQAPRPVRRRRATGRAATILLVEDEPLVRDATRAILADAGYTVLEARGGAEALALAEDPSQGIDLVLTDVVMPEMSGPRMLELLRQQRPDVRLLLMSGYTGDVRLRHGATADTALVQKPFTPDALLAAVRDALGGIED